MGDDDQRAHARFKIVVDVVAALILREILRIHHLADVVEVRADLDEIRTRSDRLCGGFRKGRRLDRVIIRRRRALIQFDHQRVRRIRVFKKLHRRNDVEVQLHHREKARCENAPHEPPQRVIKGDNDGIAQVV